MSRNGGKPFDLDAAAAARREAQKEGFSFVWHGQDYRCLPAKEWPISVSGDLSSGDLTAALGGILGDQATPFLATNPTMGDVETLMTEIAKYAGVDGLGE